MNKTLLFGIILFSSGVTIYVSIIGLWPILLSEQPIRMTFPPGAVVTDSCSIDDDGGYLSLKLQFFEENSSRRVSVPTHVLITGPDNKVVHNTNYDRSINPFYGSKPPGLYYVTITNQLDDANTSTQQANTIQYDLICMTKDGYKLGQNLGGGVVLGNLMYLVGFPILIYGIVKQVRTHRKLQLQKSMDSAMIDSAMPIRSAPQSDVRASLKRPAGITILGILSIVGGIFSIIMAFASFLLAAVVIFTPTETLELFREDVFGGLGSYAESRDLLGALLILFGGLLLGLGIANVIVAYGLLKGRKWAWSFAVVLSIVGIIIDIVFVILVPLSDVSLQENISSTAIGVAISAIILYYLHRQNVKAFFGRIIESR